MRMVDVSEKTTSPFAVNLETIPGYIFGELVWLEVLLLLDLPACCKHEQ